MNPNDVQIRKPEPADINFIYDTFRSSMKHDSKLGKSCRTSIFNKEFPKVMDKILTTGEALIACVSNEPNVILGYLLYSDNIIHYCFVKHAFRKLHIAYMLLAHAFGVTENRVIQCSLLTETARKILKEKPLLLIDHNPFILFNKGA